MRRMVFALGLALVLGGCLKPEVVDGQITCPHPVDLFRLAPLTTVEEHEWPGLEARSTFDSSLAGPKTAVIAMVENRSVDARWMPRLCVRFDAWLDQRGFTWVDASGNGVPDAQVLLIFDDLWAGGRPSGAPPEYAFQQSVGPNIEFLTGAEAVAVRAPRAP